MRRRLVSLLAMVFLCLMTYGSAWANGAGLVWVALSENGGVHAEAADSLRAEVEQAQAGRNEWRVGHWSQFRVAAAKPALVIAVGSVALRGMQEQFATDAAPPPLVAILVPRLNFERIADPARLRAGSLSAVFLDQPAARQLELIRLALPMVRNVGMLAGDESRGFVPALEKAAAERGLRLVVSRVGETGIFPALQSLLGEADLVLAQPDPSVFNSQTVANILTAAYRRQIPLLGFSSAYARAGALMSLYSTPAQVGARAGEMMRQIQAGKPLPPPQWPREFVVTVNPDVARSLGMVLDGEQLGRLLRQRERP